MYSIYCIDESGLEPQPEQMEGSIVVVCCHGHGVAHLFSVSTSLSFFSREYAEAFVELCNSRTKGTEELGNARSNKNRRGVQDVKEYLYSQCQDWFELGNVPEHNYNEHNHRSKSINRS